MSAATIHSPATTETTTRPGLPRQRTAPTRRTSAPCAPRLRLVRDPVPVTTALTRRGRLVLLLALVGIAAVLAFVVSGLVAGISPAPASAQAHAPTRIVIVQPGQTLWSIARDIAPGADRRETIARIVQLNALPSTDVTAGTRLAVPTR